ncbi:MAG TPA: hypothetical protein VE544_05510 [Nitrososphaeraceae archaeon]|nr:hypothetical protein [Nitrososphaeraceae archaeon]
MAYIRRSTTLRTIRLTRDIDNLLQKDAKSKRISTNSLLTSIITKYAEWDRYAEKFGLVSLTRADSRSILEAIDDNKLSQIGIDLGKRAFKEFLMIWFKKADVEKVLEGISLWCKYAGIAEYDLETDGRNYTITLHHEIGEKWSNLIGHLISQGIKTELGLLNATLDFTNNLIIIKFFVP